MEPPGGRDSRFNLGYSMNLLSGESAPEIYGSPNLGRPSTSLQQLSPRHSNLVSSACGGRSLKSDIYDERGMSSQNMGLESCVNDINEDTYSSMQSKKSPPSNGKKTKGRVKIKMEYIENKLRRYTTFSKRKTGIMKKAYELSTLTGTQVMLLVASETGHVYTFATRKLQPMITSEAGKALIQTCLNSPDPPAGASGGDQRMSATGFEETELTYNISDDDSKDGESGSTAESSDEMEHGDENTDTSERSKLPQTISFPTVNQDRNHREESTYIPKSNANAYDMNTSTTNLNNDTEKLCKSDSNLNPIAQISNILSSRNVVMNNFPTVTTNSSATLNSSLPLIVPNNISSSTNLSVNIAPSNVSSSSPNFQALPLLVQTPGGVGYASTPDGMVLALLQGANISQPQLVALPTSSIGQALPKSETSDKNPS